MEESPYVFFLGFAFLWILLGLGSIFVLVKSQGPTTKFPPEALLVGIPILVAFAIALTFGAISL
ncbi:hypothetical protein [Altericista sp. CCNU0014]|uniref:hypothetical protein n=1 Tax=Altericista sp. CCNU0014 TaxID=3082949 RepID=UPI00384BDA1F